MILAKTYPLRTCRKCSLPDHEPISCSVAAELSLEVSMRLARAVFAPADAGDPVAEAWLWYDEQLASHGIAADHHGQHLKVLEQMKARKPAVHPAERLSKPAETRGKAENPRAKPANQPKPADISREPATETRGSQDETREWMCVKCGNVWPKRKNAKKPPVECPKCRNRRWRE